MPQNRVRKENPKVSVRETLSLAKDRTEDESGEEAADEGVARAVQVHDLLLGELGNGVLGHHPILREDRLARAARHLPSRHTVIDVHFVLSVSTGRFQSPIRTWDSSNDSRGS